MHLKQYFEQREEKNRASHLAPLDITQYPIPLINLLSNSFEVGPDLPASTGKSQSLSDEINKFMRQVELIPLFLANIILVNFLVEQTQNSDIFSSISIAVSIPTTLCYKLKRKTLMLRWSCGVTQHLRKIVYLLKLNKSNILSFCLVKLIAWSD